jgi:hypothetical protein
MAVTRQIIISLRLSDFKNLPQVIVELPFLTYADVAWLISPYSFDIKPPKIYLIRTTCCP